MLDIFAKLINEKEKDFKRIIDEFKKTQTQKKQEKPEPKKSKGITSQEIKNLEWFVEVQNKIDTYGNNATNEILNLTKVSAINFRDPDKGTNSIPKEIGKLTSLKEVVIEESDGPRPDFPLEIPKEFGNLKNLEQLYITGHNVKSFPEEMSGLNNLRFVSLASMELQKIPDFLSKLPNLAQFQIKAFIGDQDKKDFFPESFASFKRASVAKDAGQFQALYTNKEREQQWKEQRAKENAEKQKQEEQKIRKLTEIIKPYIIKKLKRKRNGKKNLRN